MQPLDDRYFPNESATNAKRLVHQYGAPVVFCPHSGGILAIQGFNASAPPFIVGAYSSEPQIVESGNPLTLMIPPKYTIYFDAFAQTMIERHGKRLGRIPGAHAYAKEWTKGFSAVWDEQGRHAADQQRDRLQHHHRFFERRQQGAVGEAGRAVRRRAVAGHRARHQGGAGAGLQGRLRRDGPGEVRGDEQAGADGDARELGRRDADDASSRLPRGEVRREVPRRRRAPIAIRRVKSA